ncbi:uncharacterized protein N0V89_002125 [Didymosphaeria variabile]|uniref:Uncharacterized protein n=1 Tax=Didymosphaeria variabile TaxID=1932322 RepID=A0A9W9CE89_9PLEO|nr:uncharacterized protein N0V89_002125 [Didymosphaeria variabile]KAJ4357549.1 hypothetical protein N0V89_002125 [Didymosphaeria variabile]
MAHQGLNLAPSSRQDIISALLNDYGSSFDDGNNSPYKMSPAPAFKELPPSPPPERASARDYSNDKASHAFRKMNTPFQLRGKQYLWHFGGGYTWLGYTSVARLTRWVELFRWFSIQNCIQTPKAKIGTTLLDIDPELPSAPKIASQPETQNPFTAPADEKDLPPPPPEKSTRRQQSAMGNQSSTVRSPRKDSLHSQDGKDDMEPVRRKPLPKFTSLADLGNGPRGGKGGPLPQPRARKQSLEDTEDDRGRTMVRNDGAETVPRENAPPKLREQPTPMVAPRIVNPLPPTPKDESVAAAPIPSKKPFGGMGLPSNPKHKKGKSDTGFDVLKSATSPRAPQHQQHPAPQTITPGPTPPQPKPKTCEMRELWIKLG